MSRPRKTSVQLKVAGTFRKDRHGDDPGSVGELACPADFDDDQRWCWDQHYPQVKANGAGGGDLGVFLGGCKWWALFVKCERKVNAGNEDYRLYIKMSMAWKNWDRAASRLGLTPTDRAKLRIPEKPKQSGKSKFFA